MKRFKKLPPNEILKETAGVLLNAIRKGTPVTINSPMGVKMSGILFLKSMYKINQYNKGEYRNICLDQTFGFRPLSVSCGSTNVQFDHETFADLIGQAVVEWFAEQANKYPGPNGGGQWYPFLGSILGQIDHVINHVEAKGNVSVEFTIKDNEQLIQTVTTTTIHQ